MIIDDAGPTQDELDMAGRHAQSIMTDTGGTRMLVVAEIMALLVAYIAAQIEHAGSDAPEADTARLMGEVTARGIAYHMAGVIGRGVLQ